MPKLTDQFFNDLVYVYFAVFAAGFAFQFLLRRRLKKHYPEIWSEIGNSGPLNNSVGSGLRFTKWLLQKKFEGLNDPTLNFYGRGARAGFLAIIVFLIAVVTLILVGQHQNGIWNKPLVVKTRVSPHAIPLMVMAVAGMAFHGAFLARLKARHSQTWESLGRPSLFFNNTISNGWKVMGFLWSGRFAKLNDMWLNCYAVAIIVLAIAFLGLGILR